jgi:Skp family chaperone for outer membrane proteins
MTESTADLLKRRLKEVDADREKRLKEISKLGDQLRNDPNNAKVREEIAAKKAEISKVYDEAAELARAVSSISGGKNYFPAP